jgi:sugar phosphate isomerase/epimerase
MLFHIFPALVVCALSHPFMQPPPSNPPPAMRDDSAAESLGWRLGAQAWTFRDRTAFEAIDAARALGLKAIELYPGQPLSQADPDAKVGPELGVEQRAALKARLAAAKVKPVSFGVVNFKNDEPAARKVFDFAKDLGLETVTCEPAQDALDLVERLAKEYRINAAIHNHPKPSPYWNPATVLEAVKDRSPRLGACADTGHWSRSGLDPVGCLRQLRGRIITLHFKDVREGHDVPWGTGESGAGAMLAELHRQGFKGVICLEYETGSGPQVEADAARCVAFFDKAAAELAAEAAGKR